MRLLHVCRFKHGHDVLRRRTYQIYCVAESVLCELARVLLEHSVDGTEPCADFDADVRLRIESKIFFFFLLLLLLLFLLLLLLLPIPTRR
jgi:hypothetical protein